MTALIRSLMQLGLSRLLATGAGAALIGFLADVGITQDQLVDYATVVTFGLVVTGGRMLRKIPAGETLSRWWNYVMSLGRSKVEPEYLDSPMGE